MFCGIFGCFLEIFGAFWKIFSFFEIFVGVGFGAGTWTVHVSSFSERTSQLSPLWPAGLLVTPKLMHLLRCLSFLEAHFGYGHRASYQPEKENLLADALSRDCITEFYSLLPQAAKNPSSVPLTLAELLLDLTLSWTSPRLEGLVQGYFVWGSVSSTSKAYTCTRNCYLAFSSQYKLPPCPSLSTQLACSPPSSPSKV